MSLMMKQKMKVNVAASNSVKAPVQPCRVMLGSALPRSMRARVQANNRVCSAPKRKAGAQSDSVRRERAVSPTGKVALGPWLGPFETLAHEAELPATLYLDRYGSAHLSLDDAPTSSAESTSGAKISRSSMELASNQWAKPGAAKTANWTRNCASSLRKNNQLNQARPRSMSA